MPQEVLDYITSQRVCVLAVEMPDGSPHGATLHFASNTHGDCFYFLTSPSYKKVDALKARTTSRATVVLGTDEEEMRTLQLDGYVQLLLDADSTVFNETYYRKFPEKTGQFPNDLAFTFTPTWWRFTDWTRPEGKFIVNSDSKE